MIRIKLNNFYLNLILIYFIMFKFGFNIVLFEYELIMSIKIRIQTKYELVSNFFFFQPDNF